MAAVVSSLLLEKPAAPSGPAMPSSQSSADADAAAAAARSEAEAEAATRRAALARLAGGRLGTIATSARGVLGPGQSAVVRRSLLGG